MSDGKSKEAVTSWGWGRPAPPMSEILAYRKFSVPIAAALVLGLPGLLVYALTSCGEGGAFSWLWNARAITWCVLYPVLVVVCALPIFALSLVAFSHVLSPAGPCNSDEFFEFRDEAFGAKWRGKKIPIQELYEAWFDQKVDIKMDILQFIYRRAEWARLTLNLWHFKFFIFQFIPELLVHSRAQDVEQVRDHYDRGDDFYSRFLGKLMVYTSGIFHDANNDSLEQAQVNKFNLVCNKMHVKPGDKVLDMGCGWGSLTVHMAKQFQADVTAVTLGRNQQKYVNGVIEQNGVSRNARALCMDYRDVPAGPTDPKFDKIVCLEMSEHVGVRLYHKFVGQVYDMLQDDGVFFLQIAGLRRAWQIEDLIWGLFMGKYVFPGADASCPLAWVVGQLEAGGFEVHSVETIGIHYSATIKRWYDNWLADEAKEYISKKYGVRLYRLWTWFLAWAVMTAEQGGATCYQLVCHKNISKFDRKRYVEERKNYKL